MPTLPRHRRARATRPQGGATMGDGATVVLPPVSVSGGVAMVHSGTPVGRQWCCQNSFFFLILGLFFLLVVQIFGSFVAQFFSINANPLISCSKLLF